MNGLAHYARRDDTEQLCLAVRKVADAVCGLAKNAAQSVPKCLFYFSPIL